MYPLQLQIVDLNGKQVKLYVPDLAGSDINEKQKTSLFWAKVWPASTALSKFLLAHPLFITNKNVVELGAGLGLPSLTAASFAQHIYCSDSVKQAVDVIAASVAHNGITNISCSVNSWDQIISFPKPDVLLLSDVAYNPDHFDVLHSVIMYCLNNGAKVIVSTPQRLTAGLFMEKLMPYCTLQEEFIINEEEACVYTTVFCLSRNSQDLV